MLQGHNLIFATFCCLLVVTTQFVDDISASITTEGAATIDTPATTPATTSSQEERDHIKNYHSDSSLYSDELNSSDDYEDDLDVKFDAGVLRRLHEGTQQDHEWDTLIFTQQWPVTTCYHWREEDHKHECKLPTTKEFWTIHGVWPTKLGQIGPSFCNNSAEFDVDLLQKIEAPLELFWPDIHAEDTQYNWLWKHEWLKHGTCATQLAALGNELLYFGQALNWRGDYLISNLLGAAGIHPDSNNTVIALQTALVKALGKNPSIHCLYDDKKDVSYLSEIRICFKKTLELMDCDGVKRGDAVLIKYPGGTVNTNCHISKPVHYPSLVPPLQRKQQEKWRFPVVNMYKLLQFIMWFTL